MPGSFLALLTALLHLTGNLSCVSRTSYFSGPKGRLCSYTAQRGERRVLLEMVGLVFKPTYAMAVFVFEQT